jgi:ribulose-phosphate 3-epimerase
MALQKNNITTEPMTKNIQVSASILCADFTKLGDEIRKCEDAGVDTLHVDVMDGHFVPNISIGQVIVEAIRPVTKLPIEAHLMIENPGRYIGDFINAGADIISIHAECYGERRAQCRQEGQFPKEIDTIDVDRALKDIDAIQGKGKKAFMAINPGTPVCFGSLLSCLDGILIMSVNPGFAKQKFMPGTLMKVENLRKTYDGDISIDGGVNESTAPGAVRAGVNILATASYFFGSDDPQKTVERLKSLKRT